MYCMYYRANYSCHGSCSKGKPYLKTPTIEITGPLDMLVDMYVGQNKFLYLLVQGCSGLVRVYSTTNHTMTLYTPVLETQKCL